MSPPNIKTRLLGHPVTVAFSAGYGFVSLYLLYQATQLWPLIFPAAFLMHRVTHAHAQVVSYKRWKRQWDAMGGNTERRPGFAAKKLVGVILGLALVGSYIAIANNNGNEAAVGVFMILGVAYFAMVLMAKLWAWSRRRRPAAKVTPVTVCVTKPLMAVPDMSSAYRGLPEHCLRVLSRVS
jgi:hypothetical protein